MGKFILNIKLRKERMQVYRIIMLTCTDYCKYHFIY